MSREVVETAQDLALYAASPITVVETVFACMGYNTNNVDLAISKEIVCLLRNFSS